MERQNPIASALQAIGALPSITKEHELACLERTKQLEKTVYDWNVDELSMTLIHGYYQSDGRKADQVLQTPFKNFCIAKVGSEYQLFEIGCCYRPIIASFKEHPEIKQWFEEASGLLI